MSSGVSRIFDVENIYRDIENLLTGNVIGEDNRRKPIPGSALINDKGVVFIMTIIKSHVNKNIYLSDVDDLFINQKCVDIFTDVYINLIEDLDEYGIKSLEHVNIICETIDTSIYASMRRAYRGLERQKYYDSMTEQYRHTDSSGGIGGLNLGGGR